MIRLLRSAAAAVLVLAPPCALGSVDEPVTLKYTWTKGEVQRFRMTTDMNSVMTGPQEMKTSQKQVMTMHIEVKEAAPDGRATLEAVMDSVVVDMKMPMGEQHYDSTKPGEGDESPMTKAYGAMIGAPLTMEIDGRGALAKVSGFDAVLEKMLKDLGEDGGGRMAKMMKASFTEATIKRMIGPSFGIFPDHPVKTGDTWPVEFTMPAPMIGKLGVEQTYTLAGVDGEAGRRIAHLSMTGKMKRIASGPDDPPDPMADSGIKVELAETTMTGETAFESDAGRIARFASESVMKAKMSFGGDEEGGGMNQEIHTKMVMERVPGDPPPAAPAAGEGGKGAK